MPIIEDRGPRFIVRCDNCSEDMGSEDYGGQILWSDREEALEQVGEWKWRIDDTGVITCEGCIEEERLEAEATAASPAASPEGGDDG